jgi:hypothetical protein
MVAADAMEGSERAWRNRKKRVDLVRGAADTARKGWGGCWCCRDRKGKRKRKKTGRREKTMF